MSRLSQYTEILPDGTRRVVRYNPHHDGPVSERITALKKLKWLDHHCQTHPTDLKAKGERRQAAQHLAQLDAQISRLKSQREAPVLSAHDSAQP